MPPFRSLKLPGCGAAHARLGHRVDLHDVIWLVVMWVALIALWGSSDRWSLGGVRRRLTDAVYGLCHHGASPRA
jgi:hypothetical protein